MKKLFFQGMTARENVVMGKQPVWNSGTARQKYCEYVIRVPSLLLGLVVLPFCSLTFAQDAEKVVDVTELSIEELMNIEITSVSKKSQRLSEAAAAIYVITQDDLRRSGVMTIADALRMVPGLQVANIDGNKWAITSRGFNSLYANKLLVLMDGRTIYSPLFSGVHWDIQDTVIADIDRIEVIRGPGATLWGTNAVNGVINIITKKSQDTQKGLANVTAGTQTKAIGALRYGGRMGKAGTYRVFLKYADHNANVHANGDDHDDEWTIQRGGFRTETSLTSSDTLTIQGDTYDGETGERVEAPTLQDPFTESYADNMQVSGSNILSRWTRRLANRSEVAVQLYVDQVERKERLLDEKLDTWDVELQHQFLAGDKHEIVWGVGFRQNRDRTKGSFAYSYDPPNRTDSFMSAFVQDNIALVRDRLVLTAGTKVERNGYGTSTDVQPNLRLIWTPNESNAIWGAVSRANRSPSRVDTNVSIYFYTFSMGPFSPPGATGITGNPDLDSETLTAYEIGYRVKASRALSFDLTAFLNKYDDGIADNHEASGAGSSSEFRSNPTAHMAFFNPFTNGLTGETQGVEVVSNWQVIDRWKLLGSYSYLEMDLDTPDAFIKGTERNVPRSQFNIRSYFDLKEGWEFDTLIYRVGHLQNQSVPAYARVDLRLGWQMNKRLEWSVGVQNAGDSQHPEYGSGSFLVASQIERNVYTKLNWEF